LNGLEITTLEDSFDLLGLQLLILILTLLLIAEYSKLAVTKLDVVLIVPLILMEEILDLLMAVLELVKRLSPFLLTFLMELGLFNGHGLEEPLLLEITTLVWITRSLVDLLHLLNLRPFLLVETTLIQINRSASSSTQTDFTDV